MQNPTTTNTNTITIICQIHDLFSRMQLDIKNGTLYEQEQVVCSVNRAFEKAKDLRDLLGTLMMRSAETFTLYYKDGNEMLDEDPLTLDIGEVTAVFEPLDESVQIDPALLLMSPVLSSSLSAVDQSGNPVFDQSAALNVTLFFLLGHDRKPTTPPPNHRIRPANETHDGIQSQTPPSPPRPKHLARPSQDGHR